VCDFFLPFKHTRGLLKLSTRVPAPCIGSARGYTRAVLVTVAGLLGGFSAWVGQSSPPVVKRTPLRGLESGTAQSAGWGIPPLACACDLIFFFFFFFFLHRKNKSEKYLFHSLGQ
jgi:hypothetical protein